MEPRRKKRKLIEFDGTANPSLECKEQSIDTPDTINTDNNKENNSSTNNQPSKTKKSKDKKKSPKNAKSKKQSKGKSKAKAKAKSKSKSDEAKVSTSNAEDTKKEIERLKSKHKELLQQGYKCIVGVDEAGRGPLAGPVVIAAAYVPIDIYIEGITDSKKINQESEREKLYEIIVNTPEIKYSVSILDHNIIDEYNILEASLMGMRECVRKLHDSMVNGGDGDGDIVGVDYALADGNRDPRFEYPEGLKYEYIIKGDGNVYCIGAASIIAKVTRDRMMEEYDTKWPEYKFKENKGYPTPFHKELVMKNGPCDIHRKTFKPVKDWYKLHKPEVYEKVEELKKKRAEERKKKLAAKKKEQEQDMDIENGKTKKKKRRKKSKSMKKEKGQKSIMNFFGNIKHLKMKNEDKKIKEMRDKDNDDVVEEKDVESDNE